MFITKKGTYAVRRIYGSETTLVYMHREVMRVTDDRVVDHRYHNCLDNRKEFLRICTKGQNGMNKSSHLDSKSKYLGVSPKDNRFMSQITKDGKTHYLGLYINEIDAALSYNDAAIKYHGEFANLNNI